jgi:hypothetical protein
LKIKIQFADEIMFLENALLSGRQMDGSPTSCYIGTMDPDEIHSYLYFANRAVIKLLVDQFNLPLEEAENFLISALGEALTKEYNNHFTGESDMDVKASLKFKRKSQK